MPHFKYLVMTGYFLFCRAKDLLTVDWYLNAKVRTNRNTSTSTSTSTSTNSAARNSDTVRTCCYLCTLG